MPECLGKDVSQGGKMRGGLVMWREGEDRINTSPVKMVSELLQHVSMIENESVIFFFQLQLSALPSFPPRDSGEDRR